MKGNFHVRCGVGEKLEVTSKVYLSLSEKNQSYGIESRDFVRSKIMDKKVKVKVVNTDRYGRKIGKIYYDNNRYLNLECVRTGNAWWYEYYASNEEDLKSAQEQAKRSRKGLWRGKNPVNPYKWRKKN